MEREGEGEGERSWFVWMAGGCHDGTNVPRMERERGERVRADSPQPIGLISPARGNEVIFKAWYTEFMEKKDLLVS